MKAIFTFSTVVIFGSIALFSTSCHKRCCPPCEPVYCQPCCCEPYVPCDYGHHYYGPSIYSHHRPVPERGCHRHYHSY